jgi:hypothetical protein
MTDADIVAQLILLIVVVFFGVPVVKELFYLWRHRR